MEGRDGKGYNEMEQIQRGLEAFLEKEIEVIDVKRLTPAEGVQGEKGKDYGDLPLRQRQEDGSGREDLPDGQREAKIEASEDLPPEQRQRNDSDYEGPADGQWQENSRNFDNLTEEQWGRDYGEFRKLSDEKRGENGGNLPQEQDDRGLLSEDWDCSAHAIDSRKRKSKEGEIKVIGQRTTGQRAASKECAVQGMAGRGTAGKEEARRRAAGPRTAGKEAAGRRAAEKGAPAEKEAALQNPAGKEDGIRKAKERGTAGKCGTENVPAQDRTEEKMTASTKKKAGKPPKKKGSGLMAKLRRLLIAAVLIVALLGFGLYQLVGFAYGKMTFREVESMASLPMKEQGVVNILLIGNDSRENGEDGRSDAMILLSVSNRTKKIYMTSLLRDIYVEIPGYDDNRLNAAYSFGGAELLMETIEKNFNIPVHRYLLVNFEAFAGLVDAVGGVDLELTTDEIVFVNGYLSEYNRLTNRPEGTDNMDVSAGGMVHLNGPQALAYSRNRYIGTDFGRTERQRKVLTEVIGKLPKAVLTNAGGLIEGLMSNLTTNLTQAECFRLSLMAGKLLTYEIVSDSIPQPGTYSNATIRNMSVLELDFETNIRYLKEKIYGE